MFPSNQTKRIRFNTTFIVLLCFICLLVSTNVLAQVSGAAYFSIGPGFTDSIPRQIVRTQEDRVYLFAPRAQANNQVNVFWTNSAGLPTGSNAFTGSTSFTETAYPLSVDAVYDGVTTIHVLVNTNGGFVKDYPFDTTTNTFRAPIILASGVPSISGDYIGSVGVSGMVDQNNLLHVTYWTNSNHIIHQAYTYNTGNNALLPAGGSFQVDTAGNANHPAVAVSPLDNSLTVAWVSEATSPARILARTRSTNGSWGSIENVSTAPVWTSRNSGVNIDQGPSVLITPNGTKHLTYIENWDSTNNYGHVHYATNSGSSWSDTALSFYSHNPGLATNAQGDIYLIGHGAVQTGENENLYTLKKNGDGSWGSPQLFAASPSTGSFDVSPSIKWSVKGFNRPETVEFAFFIANGDNYYDTTLYYGRFAAGAATNPTATPLTPTATRTPTTPPQPPTLTPVPGSGQILTLQVATGADDVNEVNGSLTTNSNTVWIGNGGSPTTSYTGLRFNNVTIPQGASITSARLEVYSSQSQWVNLSLQIAGDNSNDSASFSPTTLPSQRTLTASRVNHGSDVSWSANTWYTVSEIPSLIQEIVNRSGWQTGSDLSLILRGTSTGSWGRKFVQAFEGNSTFAPRLVVAFNANTGGGNPPTNTPTATPTLTPTATASLTPTASSGSQTLTIPINTGADDVNEINGNLELSNATVWIGNAGSTTTSFTGLRFNNVAVPPGATITAARLEFYSTQSQWQNLSLQIAAEATNNSPVFSATNRPSQRSLTTARVNHSSNVSWSANAWYAFDGIAPVLQEVINRPGWQSRNSLSIILRGTGTTTWGRKFVRSIEGGSTMAIRLVITFR